MHKMQKNISHISLKTNYVFFIQSAGFCLVLAILSVLPGSGQLLSKLSLNQVENADLA